MDLPQLRDREIEQAVVGCALMGEIGAVGPEAFTNVELRDIWRRIKHQERQGAPIDILTVSQDHPDWSATLTKCISETPSSVHLEAYAHRLSNLASRRALVHAASTLVKETLSTESDLEEILGRHFSRLSEVSHGEVEGARPLNFEAAADEALDAIARPRDVWGMRSGWGPWDQELGGVHIREVVLVAGTPGAGKSMFTMQTALQLGGVPIFPGQTVGEPEPGAVFQLEMGEKAIVNRAACAVGKVNHRRLRTGRMEPEEQSRYFDALERIRQAPILFSKSTEWTTDLLKVEVAGLIRDHGIRWVLVDYAGKLKDGGDDEIRRERRISQGLADIAHLGVAVIVVEQLNKEGKIYGSVQKQYDADVIFKMTRAAGEDAPKDKRRMRLEKAREADISMRFDLRLVGAEKRVEPWSVPSAMEVGDDIPF